MKNGFQLEFFPFPKEQAKPAGLAATKICPRKTWPPSGKVRARPLLWRRRRGQVWQKERENSKERLEIVGNRERPRRDRAGAQPEPGSLLPRSGRPPGGMERGKISPVAHWHS